MNISEKKRELRESMLGKRKDAPLNALQESSTKLCYQLWEIITKQKVTCIHSFLPMSREVNLWPLLKMALEQELKVVAPKTLKKPTLQHLVLENIEDLENGVFGTKHPNSGKIYTGNYDLIIVPGLAFDDKKNRLGYGAGYYDSFLKNHPTAYKVGVAYPFQILANVPVEKHDVPLDLVLS